MLEGEVDFLSEEEYFSLFRHVSLFVKQKMYMNKRCYAAFKNRFSGIIHFRNRIQNKNRKNKYILSIPSSLNIINLLLHRHRWLQHVCAKIPGLYCTKLISLSLLLSCYFVHTHYSAYTCSNRRQYLTRIFNLFKSIIKFRLKYIYDKNRYSYF